MKSTSSTRSWPFSRHDQEALLIGDLVHVGDEAHQRGESAAPVQDQDDRRRLVRGVPRRDVDLVVALATSVVEPAAVVARTMVVARRGEPRQGHAIVGAGQATGWARGDAVGSLLIGSRAAQDVARPALERCQDAQRDEQALGEVGHQHTVRHSRGDQGGAFYVELQPASYQSVLCAKRCARLRAWSW
jgi:hypothetical protein